MQISTNLFQADYCLSQTWSCCQKVACNCTILSQFCLVTLQGSVCTQVRWSGQF